ncbi:MAG TPA: hypothetical protein VGJ51_08980 [Candidatus Angelobacter sp.]
MRVKHGVAVIVMLAFYCTLSVFGQEKKLKKSDLPAAVQKTADEQSKGATVRGYGQETEDGKVAYEVQLIVNGHSKDVTIDPQGNIMEVEEQVDLNSLPAEVRAGLEKQAGKATVSKVESLTKHGTLVAYEAQVRNGKKRSEIQLGPDGKPLAHKE